MDVSLNTFPAEAGVDAKRILSGVESQRMTDDLDKVKKQEVSVALQTVIGQEARVVAGGTII